MDTLAPVGQNFRHWLHSRRAASGKSYRVLGEECGISHSQVQWLEQGEREPTLPVIRAMAKAFDAPLDEVLQAAFPDMFGGYTAEERQSLCRWLAADGGEA